MMVHGPVMDALAAAGPRRRWAVAHRAALSFQTASALAAAARLGIGCAPDLMWRTSPDVAPHSLHSAHQRSYIDPCRTDTFEPPQNGHGSTSGFVSSLILYSTAQH